MAADREKELLERGSAQEAHMKSMIEKMEKLDRTANLNESSLMDKSSMLDQMSNI